MYLYKLNDTELDSLCLKCNHLNIDSFQSKEREYNAILTQISSLKIQLEIIKNNPKGQVSLEQIKEISDLIKKGKVGENKLEKELFNISSQSSDIFSRYELPTKFGNNDIVNPELLKVVTYFNPDTPNNKLSHTWECLKDLNQSQQVNLSKEGLKTALRILCKGRALDLCIKYKNEPVESFINNLGNYFEKPLSRDGYENQLRYFQRKQNETLLQCLYHLKSIIKSLYAE